MIFKRRLSYYRRHWKSYVRKLVLKAFPSRQPSFMILGVQKAATTSLSNYLNQLPEFCGSVNKEVNYFSQEIFYGKSIGWYHSFFKSTSLSNNLYFFDATPEYLYYPWVAESIASYKKDLKFIIVLREPVARAYSAWKMYEGFFRRKEFYRVARGLRPGEENSINTFFFKDRDSFPTFEECVDMELKLISEGTNTWEPSFLRRGLYADQLQRYLKYFKPEQLLIVGFKDLTLKPNEELKKIYSFITGRSQPTSSTSLLKRNSMERVANIPDAVRVKLNDFFSGPNKELEVLLEKKINW